MFAFICSCRKGHHKGTKRLLNAPNIIHGPLLLVAKLDILYNNEEAKREVRGSDSVQILVSLLSLCNVFLLAHFAWFQCVNLFDWHCNILRCSLGKISRWKSVLKFMILLTLSHSLLTLLFCFNLSWVLLIWPCISWQQTWCIPSSSHHLLQEKPCKQFEWHQMLIINWCIHT